MVRAELNGLPIGLARTGDARCDSRALIDRDAVPSRSRWIDLRQVELIAVRTIGVLPSAVSQLLEQCPKVVTGGGLSCYIG